MILQITQRSVAKSAFSFLLQRRRPRLDVLRRSLSSSSSVDQSVLLGHNNDGKGYQSEGWMDSDGLTVFNTLHELVDRSCHLFADRKMFGTYNEEVNKFEWMTYANFDGKVHQCRAVLKELGVNQYDKIGIISNNRWEWAAIAGAAYSLNANIVPMYEAQLPSDWRYILNDSNASVLFCATEDIFRRVQTEVIPNTPGVNAVLCLDAGDGESHGFTTAMNSVEPDTDRKLVQAPLPEDLANLIYTSGTTGKPKGVELTHLNFTSNAQGAARSMAKEASQFLSADDRSLAFLPWAHSYGQTCELWTGISFGIGIGVCRGVPSILEDLGHVKPSILFAVPTLFKKIHDGVHNAMNDASPTKQYLMREALDVGAKKVLADRSNDSNFSLGDRIKHSVLDALVLSKIRERFGGNLRLGFVAGAACPEKVLHFMDAVGIPVCEGYGLTETSPIIALNTPNCRKVGCVGQPIGDVTVFVIGQDGHEVAQGEEGEVCCVGPNVMRGYYNNQEATDEVISISPDGTSRSMFHTGDLGYIDADGFVKITGRLKEQYKLENGKYIVPTPIEEAIGMSPFIQQVVISGANRPYNVAFIVPEWTAIRSELGMREDMAEEEMVNDEQANMLIDEGIQNACEGLKTFEIPRAWTIVAPFTAANQQLTPKMSIRRHKVIETYAAEINRMYGDDAAISDTVDSSTSADQHPRDYEVENRVA